MKYIYRIFQVFVSIPVATIGAIIPVVGGRAS